jgi:hypothetical protein
MLCLFLASPSVVTAQTQETSLPFVKTVVRVIPLNDQLKGNVSYIDWSLPNPEIGDEGVVRMGGNIETDQGEPLAAWLWGEKGPANVPLVLGFTPGDGGKSLQFTACVPGPDANPEPYNDRMKYLAVSEWAVKEGATVTLWADDNESGGAGVSQTIDYAQLVAAPKVEILALLLPERMDNKASLVTTALNDSWSQDLGNIGAFYLGWKDGSARGVGLKNSGQFDQTLQVPECQVPGGEAVNDMHKPWLFIEKNQLFAKGSPQGATVFENDIEPFGEELMIDLNNPDYRDPFITRMLLPYVSG